MDLYELVAVGIAFLWASTSLLAVMPSTHLGAIGYSRWRMYVAGAILVALATAMGTWGTLSYDDIIWLGLSGVVGIFIGDTSLQACLNILGPRRSSILYASNSVFTVILAMWLLGESLSGMALIGSALVISGVMVAIFFGKRRNNAHLWEQNRGKIWIGIAFGLLAALSQASGAIIAKPVMQEGVDPLAANAVRTLATVAVHVILRVLFPRRFRSTYPITWPVFRRLALVAILGMGIGMTALLWAMAHGDVGIVSVLTSISPVLVLPFLWFAFRNVPPLGAWVGAFMTVSGAAIIVLF